MGWEIRILLINGTVTDDDRIAYIKVHLSAILRAMDQGVKNQRLFLFGHCLIYFSWTNGYTKRYGLFYVDFDTQQRFPKKSAYWYKNK